MRSNVMQMGNDRSMTQKGPEVRLKVGRASSWRCCVKELGPDPPRYGEAGKDLNRRMTSSTLYFRSSRVAVRKVDLSKDSLGGCCRISEKIY